MIRYSCNVKKSSLIAHNFCVFSVKAHSHRTKAKISFDAANGQKVNVFLYFNLITKINLGKPSVHELVSIQNYSQPEVRDLVITYLTSIARKNLLCHNRLVFPSNF